MIPSTSNIQLLLFWFLLYLFFAVGNNNNIISQIAKEVKTVKGEFLYENSTYISSYSLISQCKRSNNPCKYKQSNTFSSCYFCNYFIFYRQVLIISLKQKQYKIQIHTASLTLKESRVKYFVVFLNNVKEIVGNINISQKKALKLTE